jgi:hypothetical protein
MTPAWHRPGAGSTRRNAAIEARSVAGSHVLGQERTMATNEDIQKQEKFFAKFREEMLEVLAPHLIGRPELADQFLRRIEQMEARVDKPKAGDKAPPDGGLAQLIGLGPDAASRPEKAIQPKGVEEYDDTVTAERILAVADLYYIYQHERLGIFTAVLKLQELFNAGAIRLSTGPGAYGIYRFDRRRVLRYTRTDRLQAYKRVFGYTATPPAPGAQPNTTFHGLFVQFVNGVAEFFRDKRVSEVIRPRASDPSFGSIAVVRRSGLDLRNNLKNASYGHVNIMRIEVLQLLDEAFRILGTDDVKNLFGADNAWDVLEEIMRRYFGQPQITASQRNRMAETGRDIIQWLAEPYILNTTRVEFETFLTEIGPAAEEWVTSAEALGIAQREQEPMQRPRRPSGSDRRRLPTSRRQPALIGGRQEELGNGWHEESWD